MKIALGNKEYEFLVGYQKEAKHRNALNALVKKIFGISFEDWYKAGYWNEKYIPYSLFDGEKAIANVSVNIMDFIILGEKKRYIQIGTNLTDEQYRNKKLSRFLMEQVLKEWNDKCDLIYLYANRTVLEFYPKFDFKSVKEYEYYKSIENKNSKEQAEKLDMDLKSNRDKLYEYAKNTRVYGKISMQENADLVMFYCTSFLKDNVYYIKSLNVIAVAIFKEEELHLWDVFGKFEGPLDHIIDSLANSKTKKVILGFTPKEDSSYEIREISGDDTLFVQNDKTMLFNKNKMMFPLLSHA